MIKLFPTTQCFVDVPGTIVDVACLNLREKDSHGPFKICLLHGSEGRKDHGTKLTLFELAKEMVQGKKQLNL